MGAWRQLTLGELMGTLWRYRQFAVIVAVTALVATLAPGPRPEKSESLSAGNVGGEVVVPGGQPAAVPGVDAAGIPVAAGGSGLATSGGSTLGQARTSSRAPAIAGAASKDPLQAADCDVATRRIKMPSKFAPPCVADWPKGADNGGSTHRGVTAKEIVVAIRFNPNPNPAVSATLTAAGAEDTREDVRATRQAWADYFEAHHQTYGRKVKIVYVEQSGDSEDEAAGRADAIKVATEIKAFAAWGGSGTYREELTARGVVCLCGGRDVKFFLDRKPYLWGTQPAYEQWLWPGAEYIGKKLWNREAKHAGDPVYQTQKRKFAIVYLESSTSPVAAGGVASMEKEMAKYGAKFTDKISYTGDIESAQEQARVVIARLKDKGITTVAFWGDPLAPIFLTQEATRQAYRPEWLLLGGNLVDTTFFSRTYDPVQWEHAFGISQLWARGPQAENEIYHQHMWHHGIPPQAKATYEILYQEPWAFYTALHLAGPKLTPQTYRDGLFAFPPSGGLPTLVQRSFGNHGLFPFEDYTSFDDVTEVWYDPNATGQNEIGQEGKGMLRYVDGGKRYLLGQFSTAESKVFQVAGSVTKYDKVPASDQFPKYEHRHYH